jgi:multicomponent Na+:H+ antiporter subunit G
MNLLLRLIIDLLLVAGGFFALAGVVGMLRMPDPFSRMHAATNISTMGVLCIALACFVHAVFIAGSAAAAVKIVLIVFFIFLTNPVASHALSRAAYHHHERKYRDAGLVRDDYGEDEPHA